MHVREKACPRLLVCSGFIANWGWNHPEDMPLGASVFEGFHRKLTEEGRPTLDMGVTIMGWGPGEKGQEPAELQHTLLSADAV